MKKHYHIIKWLCLMAFFAGGVSVASWFKDYRVSVGILFGLFSIGFAMAAWVFVKNKTLVAVVLASAIALQPIRAGDQPKSQGIIAALIVGGVVLAVGYVVVKGLIQICKKMPPAPRKGPNNPPATNSEPDIVYPKVRGILGKVPPLLMPVTTITPSNDWEVVVLQFQSSTNGINWKEEATATNWLNNSQMVSILYSNGVSLWTNFANLFWTNETVNSDFAPVAPKVSDDPLKLWRAVQIQ